MIQRKVTLFNRSGASTPALANNSFAGIVLSAALGEEQVYPGGFDTCPATARVNRHAAGNPSKVKFQGTSDPPDALLLSGADGARVSLVAIDAGQSIQLAQASGTSIATSSATSSGLTTITMGTNALGHPSVSAQGLADWISANLPAVFTPTVVAGGSGLMGPMAMAAAVPQAPRWVDIESTLELTVTPAAEHTLDPGAGLTADFGFQVRTAGWRAVRCLGTCAAAPNAADAVLVTMSVPG